MKLIIETDLDPRELVRVRQALKANDVTLGWSEIYATRITSVEECPPAATAAPGTLRLQKLEWEIRTQRNSLSASLSARRQHPTYGYTKAMIVRELQHLEGLIAAWALVTGKWPHPGSPLAGYSLSPEVTLAARELEVDLDALRERVSKA